MVVFFQKRKPACLNFLFFILVCLFLAGCNFKELPVVKDAIEKNEKIITQQTDEAIKKSPELQALDKVCTQIPLPETFRFVWKGGLDDRKLALAYHYYSEMKYEEARALIQDHFARNNWTFVREDTSYPKILEFKNDKYRIEVNYGGMGDRTNYGISCEKL